VVHLLSKTVADRFNFLISHRRYPLVKHLGTSNYSGDQFVIVRFSVRQSKLLHKSKQMNCSSSKFVAGIVTLHFFLKSRRIVIIVA